MTLNNPVACVAPLACSECTCAGRENIICQPLIEPIMLELAGAYPLTTHSDYGLYWQVVQVSWLSGALADLAISGLPRKDGTDVSGVEGVIHMNVGT